MTDTSSPVIKTVLHPVSDLAKAKVVYAALLVKDAPQEVGGGRLVANITDLDGNVLGLIQDTK